MGYVAIRAAIKTKLDELVTSGSLGYVFNGEQSQQAVEIPAWPAAELIRVQTVPDYFTNREDLQDYIFVINIYQQIEEANTATVEVAMDAVIDAVMQKFLNDVNLTGVLDGRMKPIESQVAIIAWQGRQVRREQIILHCPKLKAMA